MIYIQGQKMCVKNYEFILFLDDQRIELRMKNQIVCITGEDLEVRYYSEDEIVIKGQLKNISFS